MSAGFKEIGDEGKALEEQIRSELANFPGMRIIGPNCLGIIVPGLNLNVSFANGMPKNGHVAFVSQSGALCTSVLDWALDQSLGFSYFVSIGNTIDVNFADLIDYFGEDEQTKSILLYIESLAHPRKFMTASRAFARSKPIIAYKAGRFPESAQVASSHTGAMAAEDAVYDAAFRRTGIARVFDIGDIFDCAELIGRHKIPRGPRLGIITNAGGPGVMATDALIDKKGVLAKLSDETTAQLNEKLPPFWSHGNPVDVLGDSTSKRFATATDIVLKDKGVDAVLVILTPQAMTNSTATAKAIAELASQTKKPILASWLGGGSLSEGIRILSEAGVPTYKTPEQGIGAFMTLVAYSRNLENLYETPKDIPVEFPMDRQKLRDTFDSIMADKGSILSEEVSKNLIEAYGIPVTQPRPAATEDEAVKIAESAGYPVVLKIMSPDITHKTDVGGVILNLREEGMVRAAFHQIVTSAQEKMPDARIDGVTIQKMIRLEDSVELILGIKKDSVFGTVMLVGSGGVTAELFHDSVLGFPPLNERLARHMLESLKVWPLLNGYRGRPAANIEKLVEVLIRLSYLAADYPEITELDINPLLVNETDVIALDARAVVDRSLIGQPFRRYSHLALKPYPEEYVRETVMTDGTKAILRPIKPEDEPMWMELLGSCSQESIYQRFRYFFQWATHDVASRYCYIDYDREIAIVPEIEEDGKRKLLGVGRLIADPNHDTAEYAILVGDKWQDKGLGGILTDYCMDIAKGWGVKRVIAITTTDNPRMISVFRKRGFEMKPDPDGSTVDVSKDL